MNSSEFLCSGCRRISLDSLRDNNHHLLASSRAELALSARSCPLCSLILDSYSLYLQYAPIRPAALTLSFGSRHLSALSIYEGDKELLGDGAPRFTVRIREVDRVPENDRFMALEEYTNTMSAHSFEFARSSLINCLQQHKCSQQPTIFAHEHDPETWPSRILNLNCTDLITDSDPAIKLEDFSLFTSQMQYCALSYCWGPSGLKGSYHTTIETLEERKRKIDLQNLPQTIQDAIRICRSLKIGYLWVDALCIVQDCKVDWQTESAKMGAIYARSHVTIAAEASDSADGGCFNNREESLGVALEEHFVIRNILPDGRQSCFYISPDKTTHNYSTLDMGMLGSRGWCYQEQMFSPRILHYTRRQLVWECRKNFLGADHITSTRFSKKFSLLKLDVASPESQLWSWYINVIHGDYAGRKLTFESDKVPAISSLARIYYRQIKSPYLAGLWLRDIEWGISWVCTGETSKPLYNGCPSWSWASTDSEVSWPSKPSTIPLSHVESAEVKEDSSDPFGTVSGGFIRMRGCAQEGWVEKGTLFQSEQSQLLLGCAWLDYPCETQAVVYLPLSKEEIGTLYKFFRVLLLIPCTQGLHTFRRIGVARISLDLEQDIFNNSLIQTLTII